MYVVVFLCCIKEGISLKNLRVQNSAKVTIARVWRTLSKKILKGQVLKMRTLSMWLLMESLPISEFKKNFIFDFEKNEPIQCTAFISIDHEIILRQVRYCACQIFKVIIFQFWWWKIINFFLGENTKKMCWCFKAITWKLKFFLCRAMICSNPLRIFV